MLYVSHDLATLGEISDRIAIMHAGEIVEIGPAAEILMRPRHPYTRALVGSLPRLDTPPDPGAALRGGLDRDVLPEGCRFAPRCAYAEASCRVERQALRDIGAGHSAACRRLYDGMLAFDMSRGLPERISA
jgi:oligopeptide/dipeptide ABC transporter ATP-binding protein